jgi:hypothetical protein
MRRTEPGITAMVVLFLLTVLTGTGSPFSLEREPVAPFPPVERLLAESHGSGYLGVVARRSGSLTSAQLARAISLREKLTAGQRERLDAVLSAVSLPAQGYVVEAFAAGHTVPEIAAFAAVITGRKPAWLAAHMRPVDAGETGAVQFRGSPINQYNDTSCGSTTIVATRALVDPLYALRLTTGGRPGTAEESGERFLRRLRQEEQAVHDQTDLLWPQNAGTPPWGISEWLNRDPAGLGARYRWIPAIPALSGGVLRRALDAANHGYPVPLLIGDVVPRHYVLLLRHDARGAYVYEPTIGAVVLVRQADLDRRDFGRLGFPHLAGAILPDGLS